MRNLIASVLIGLCISSSTAAPIGAEDAEMSRIEAAQDRADIWRGRTHHLYDEVYTPKTEGAATAAEQACAKEHIRVKGKDGKTAVVRQDRCD